MANFEDRIVFKKTDFDYVNPAARVVIVGITPGNSQLKGNRTGMTSREIKRNFAFAGSMRQTLIDMLNHIGVNRLLNIETCQTLWEGDFDKVEMTSLLKDATYIKTYNKKTGELEDVMFKDPKKIFLSPKLEQKMNEGFLNDIHQYRNAQLFVACGPGVYDVLKTLQNRGCFTASLVGIAHPSNLNLGRIHCYLGQKAPIDRSYIWCREKSDEAQHIINDLCQANRGV